MLIDTPLDEDELAGFELRVGLIDVVEDPPGHFAGHVLEHERQIGTAVPP
jgi:hypothetical protein